MELISDKIKIKDLLILKRNNMLTVNPEYQRGAVWSEAQQKRLVDSVMRSYPLPLIYLHYKKIEVAGLSRDSLEIIDGQQRIDALHAFADKGIRLFDPVMDDKKARFPEFIKNMPCPWAQCDYIGLSDELKKKFDDTEIFTVKVTTEIEDEARDLFIRLQAGLPLNPQEKRDAWPGGYTEFTLKLGGKYNIDRYPGHEFFRRLVFIKTTDRGEVRTLCAQLGILFFERATEGNWMDIGTQAIDEYYYRNLGFDIHQPMVTRFSKVLDIAVNIFTGYNGQKFKVHEAIHVVLLINSLLDDYSREWQGKFVTAFDNFRHNALTDKRKRDGEFWFKYSYLTMTQAAQAGSIQRRHSFFVEKMNEVLRPVRKDEIRIYGQLEREIIFYRDDKLCAVCGYEVNWKDMEIHHVDEHQNGGKTTLENGVAVHKQCHPKGQAAIDFYNKWKEKKEASKHKDVTFAPPQPGNYFASVGNTIKYKIENENKGILAYAVVTETGKFCILKGSNISRMVSDSFDVTAKAASARRFNLLRDGTISEEFVFTKDVVFNSKSNAASLVLGFSANGNTSWMPVQEKP